MPAKTPPVGARPAISTRLRFEVFKRDKFTCVYCGRKAPEVILHADHVEPVAEGGTTDLLNLVTACVGCNLGKGPHRLQDGSVIEAQRQQAETLQAKHEQLAMLAAWQRGLAQLDQTGTDEALQFWSDLTGYSLVNEAPGKLRRLIRRYGLGEVLEAIRLSVDQYGDYTDEKLTPESVENCWQKVGGICRVRREESEDPGIAELFYIRGILRNRFGLTNYQQLQAFEILRRGRDAGISAPEQRAWATKARNWSQWLDEEVKAAEQAEGEAATSPSTPGTEDAQESWESQDDPDEEEQERQLEEERERQWYEEQEEEARLEAERERRVEVSREFWDKGGRSIAKPDPRPENASASPPGAPWCCYACGEWIPALGARIEIMHAPKGGAVGGYPLGHGAAGESHDDPWGLMHTDIVIYVLHPECCPDERQGYGWHTGSTPTLEDWIGWVLHLFEKTWMARYDLYRLLAFWWTGRRLSPKDL